MQLCVLLAGEIAAGKSSVARALARRLDGEVVRVRNALTEVLDLDSDDRATLQERGAELDRHTNGRWLLEYLQRRLDRSDSLVVDALRTRRQTVPILEQIPRAVLIYLDASPETRSLRFETAKVEDPMKRSLSFSTAMNHPTEREVSALRPLAHLVVETDGLTIDQVVDEIVSMVQEHRRRSSRGGG